MASRFRGRVDDDAAVAFARATNDHNDLYLNGSAVPPLFTVSLITASQGEAIRASGPAVAVRGASTSVHAEHDVRFLGPVLPGMALQWETDRLGVRQTSGGVLVTHRTVVADADGVPLVEHLWSSLHLGGTTEDESGAEKPDHAFPEEARARPVGSRDVPVDRDQAFRYAGVSGDHIGHAIDDEIARSEGYPGKILQGLCTFALCSGAVVDVAAAGDPRRLRRLAVRFSAPAFPRRDLVVDVYDAGETTDGAKAVAFEARQDGSTVIRHGRAEVSS
jgi:acyl dehydratase